MELIEKRPLFYRYHQCPGEGSASAELRPAHEKAFEEGNLFGSVSPSLKQVGHLGQRYIDIGARGDATKRPGSEVFPSMTIIPQIPITD
jgi:hypothetical protein